MSTRRSLRLPITLGVVMIVLIVVLTVGWVLITLFGALQGVPTWLFLTMLVVGTLILVAVLVGVIVYLVLFISAINLNRRQTNFMDSVTHELKSPIASLKLYLQTFNRRQVGEAQRKDFHRFMLDDVDRLDRLINHLLDAARLDRQPEDWETEVVELSELLKQCSQSVCLRYRVPEGTVRFDLVPCGVMARRVDLDMIFRNLIDNAVKYAGDPAEVQVQVRVKDSDEVVVRIADNGRGIPIPLRRKIFGRFIRLGLELERDRPGTGLGLYIVRTLVHRLRGRVRVVGVQVGSGTVFEVHLPGSISSEQEADQAADPLSPQEVEVA